jgi:hypothetical protein
LTKQKVALNFFNNLYLEELLVRTPALAAVVCLALTGCATYNYAEKIQTVSFTDNLTKGEAVGNIRGEDCTWTVLGNQLGGAPTLDRAFINAKNQAGGLESAGFGAVNSNGGRGQSIRYVNNVHTSQEGFNAYLVGKNCIVVSGVGYK